MSVIDLFRLDGRSALVTGAGRGLGRAMALALASAGADVALVGRQSAMLEEARAEVSRAGHRTVVVRADLSDLSTHPPAVREAEAELGQIDILVNNAGINRRAAAEAFDTRDWMEVLQLNLTAVFHLTQLVARPMLERRAGKIINVASMTSFQGSILIPAYAAAKSGVAGLTRALANEWAGRGVNVNAIAPGYMETDMTRPLFEDPVRGPELFSRIPAGRWGTPGDLAGAVVFLASEASSYVHGVVLPVDGGWLAR